ncbi:DUF4129 domain-containing protein [Haloarchaeobius sp. HME9146]|uniref:DUF4129 domain-containing protein n=1 Tax=Haloarchaeobius sp. HME9146 TaxID=2978732 RepID=UPI0021BE4982|nr:DUF4129 domain-containing protein [Haloarchaeobius sp. HME9146]
MAYDLSRAAVAVVAVLTVILAASLLPASGFGTYPAGVGGGAGDTAGSGDPTAPGTDGPTSEQPPSTADSATETATEGTDGGTGSGSGSDGGTGSGSGSDGGTATPTPTRTATTTTERAAAGGAGNDRGGIDLGTVVTTFMGLLTLTGIGVVLVLTVGQVERTSRPDFDGWVLDIPGLPPLHIRASFLTIPQTTMAFLVGTSASAPEVLDAIGSAANDFARGLGAVGKGLGSLSASLFVGVPAALGKGLLAIPRGIGGGLGALTGGFSTLSSGIGSRNWLSRGEKTPDDPRNRAAASADEFTDPGAHQPSPLSIEEAWEYMVDQLPTGRSPSRTPAEYARAAVEHGLPADAVGRLTRAFQDVRYGQYPPDDSRTQAARDAVRQIARRLEGDS